MASEGLTEESSALARNFRETFGVVPERGGMSSGIGWVAMPNLRRAFVQIPPAGHPWSGLSPSLRELGAALSWPVGPDIGLMGVTGGWLCTASSIRATTVGDALELARRVGNQPRRAQVFESTWQRSPNVALTAALESKFREFTDTATAAATAAATAMAALAMYSPTAGNAPVADQCRLDLNAEPVAMSWESLRRNSGTSKRFRHLDYPPVQ